MYREQTLSTLLAYLGALPFWALVLGQFAGLDPTWTATAFVAYGTGIACFMAGTIWSQSQILKPAAGLFLLVSNGAALLGIAALLVHPAMPQTALVLQAGTFLTLLAADGQLYRSDDQPRWYFVLRRNVTIIVLAAYGLALVFRYF